MLFLYKQYFAFIISRIINLIFNSIYLNKTIFLCNILYLYPILKKIVDCNECKTNKFNEF